LDQFCNRTNISVLQTIGSPQGDIQFLDSLFKVFIKGRYLFNRLRDLLFLDLSFIECIDKDAAVILENICSMG